MTVCEDGYFCIVGSSKTRPANDDIEPKRYGLCPAGYYCLQSESPVQIKCPLGTYRDRTKAKGTDECLPCKDGNYCDRPGLDTKPTDECAEGFYCPEGSLNKFGGTAYITTGWTEDDWNPCEPGNYCEIGSGADSMSSCDKGFYTASKYLNTTCAPCLPGKYCPDKGMSSIPIANNCKAGYYCEAGSYKETDSSCDRYYHCPEGSAEQLNCNPGFYQPARQQDVCIPCEEGKICDPSNNDSLAPEPCPKGYTCDTQIGVDPARCPIGTSKPKSGSGTCEPCGRGDACDGSKPWESSTGSCTAGFVCAFGAMTEYPFSLSGVDNTTCTGLNLNTASNVCQEGSECDGAFSTECIEGYYTNLTMTTECFPCPAGYHCNNVGITDYDLDDYICAVGHWCDGTLEQACNEGTYNPRTHGLSRDDCLNCPAGYLCDSTGIGELLDALLCPAGFYCEKGAQVAQRCELGHYCEEATAATAGHSPRPCPAGYACTSFGIADYNDFQCSAGRFCEAGITSVAEIIDCPAGRYCETATPIPELCPPGTYNPSTQGATVANCLECPAGSYCPGYGNSDEEVNLPKCKSGFYCPTGSFKMNQFYCPAGFACPEGSGQPVPCNGDLGDPFNGEYQNEKGSSNCKSCPEGYYCLYAENPDYGIVEPFLCELGHYCPAGTSDYTENKCFEGTYGGIKGLKSIDECSECWGGYYCDEQGSIAGNGTTADNFVVKFCDAGYFCPTGSTAPNEQDCPVGAYCPQGSSGYRPCPRGTSRSSPSRAEKIEDCLKCPAGYYCKFSEDGTIDSIAEERCEKGFVCVEGAYIPTPNDDIEFTCNDEVSQCIEEAKLFGITGFPCPIGHKCHQQSASAQWTKCPSGTFQPRIGQSDCESCPKGYFCEDAGMEMPRACLKGTYCPGTGHKEPTECPPGMYNDRIGSFDIDQCQICPPGYYCSGGRDSPDNPCSQELSLRWFSFYRAFLT